MGYSQTEENYLKAIYKLLQNESNSVSTKSISEHLEIKPPTVSDMLKKLRYKKLIKYERYKGVSLTSMGENVALKIIRKHRLWETFLVERFKFSWDEVHEIAEQLEHIESEQLESRLDEYLDFPRFDPHGDPIPDKKGNISFRHEISLDQIESGITVIFSGVKDHSSKFLQYLENIELSLGSDIKIIERIEYDKSAIVFIRGKLKRTISHQVCRNLLVETTKEKNNIP